jgi:hypothetical protein
MSLGGVSSVGLESIRDLVVVKVPKIDVLAKVSIFEEQAFTSRHIGVRVRTVDRVVKVLTEDSVVSRNAGILLLQSKYSHLK